VSLRLATPVDDIYDAVRDHDLVLVPDAPLASAINRRLDRPHFGTFATTPRRLAAGRRETAEDRLAFLDVVERTDLDWKAAATAIGDVLQCWEHQGSIDAIFEYDRFAGPATRAVVDVLRDLATTSRRLTDHDPPTNRRVAVVGEPELTTLERSVVPEDATRVDALRSEPADLEPFRIFDSAADIVDTLLDVITPQNAEDVAVVLDESSRFSTLVESALEAANVPYYGGPGFLDEPDHRAFLRLCRLAYRGPDTRVNEVRPLLAAIGSANAVPVEHDERRLDSVDDPPVVRLREVATRIRSDTFDAALSRYEALAGTDVTPFRDELGRLGVLDTPVSETALDRLSFYLDSYEVPVERENEGVLLADATAAAHVDRPAVFYLGIDDGWTHPAPRRPWVDADAQYERNVRAFQRLLQNGVEQYYLVQDTAGGRPVTPPLYLQDLLDEEFERFADLPSTIHGRAVTTTEADGFAYDPTVSDADHEPLTTVSQSSLNTYANCPREYYFDRLLESPETLRRIEGQLFHDFAEFYAEHADAVDERALDRIVEYMVDTVRPHLRTASEATKRTRYRVGLEVIREYLDANPVLESEAGGGRRWGTNAIAELFDRSIETGVTERWFENERLGIKGLIDLVRTPTELVDYKSGSRKRARQVVDRGTVEDPADPPNFQAPLYLAHLRDQRPDEQLRFTFLHFLETLDDRIRGDHNLADCLTSVPYYPTTFETYVAREATYEALREDAYNACTKTFGQTSYEDYRTVVDEHPIPDTTDADELFESTFGQALLIRLQTVVGDYKYVRKGTRQACKYLVGIRSGAFFREDLDAFESFVEETIDEINRRRSGDERFPVAGLTDEPNYRYVDHRDCILTDR
jgi:hypothetical protein